jgi:DNA-binding MarR family transcriptional regulator
MTDRRERIDELLKDFQAIKRKLAEGTASKDRKELAPSQWLALKIIYLAAADGVGIGEIAQKLSISSSAATQTVNALEKKGFVERKEHPEDRRNTRITLSAKAKRKIAGMRERAMDTISPLFGILTDAEFSAYCTLTKKLSRSISSSSSTEHAQ